MPKTQAQIYRNMSRVRSKGSKIERAFAKALRANGLHFRRHPRSIFGIPDFVLRDQKIVIFCDSHFWHGYKWRTEKLKIQNNRRFWVNKIETNIKRDRLVNLTLKKQGWRVLRFWEDRIIESIETCIEAIQNLNRI